MGPNSGGMVLRWCPFRTMSDDPTRQPRRPTSADSFNIGACGKKVLKIFSSETAWPIGAKFWWNGPYVVPFQNLVKWPHPSAKAADISWHSFDIGPYGKNVLNKLKIFSTETVSPVGTRIWWNGLYYAGMVLGWSSFRTMSDYPTC